MLSLRTSVVVALGGVIVSATALLPASPASAQTLAWTSPAVVGEILGTAPQQPNEGQLSAAEEVEPESSYGGNGEEGTKRLGLIGAFGALAVVALFVALEVLRRSSKRLRPPASDEPGSQP